MSSTTASALPRIAGVSSWFDLTRARTCIALFLLIAVPTFVSLSLIIGPFQIPDESAHFYRAVQLSEGRAIPVRSPDGRQSGDYLDSNIHKMGGYFLYLQYIRWYKSFGAGPQDIAAVSGAALAGRREFVAFSNTAIYFPLVHAAPALAIVVMRALHTRPLAWMYGGRLLNSALAILIFCLALAWFPEGRVFVFVLALLPRTIFGTASLSADALLIPFAALFAALVARLAHQGRLSLLQYSLLIFSTLFVCTGKLAYIPMAAIPPAIALISVGRGRATAILGFSGLAIVLTWLVWMHAMNPYALPIRHDVHIDVYGQLHNLIARPLSGPAVLFRSLARDGFGYMDTFVGGELGSSHTRFSRVLSAVTYIFVVGAAFAARDRFKANWVAFSVSVFFAIGSAVAIFLLVYMQYTGLNNPFVEGVWGRYFLPLAPICIAFLPKFRLPERFSGTASLLTVCWFVFASAQTIHLMRSRYSNLVPAAGQRFGDPHNFLVE